MNNNNVILSVILSLIIQVTYAQFTVSAELRPRGEYRHGYSTIFGENEDPAFFVSQRTRLNAQYKTEKLETFVSFQNVRVWGDVPQISNSDENGVAIWQAWGKLNLNNNWALKLGRQELVYDDERFYGNSQWRQASRVHDALLLLFKKEKFEIDVALAFNQSSQNLSGTTLLTPNQYKTLQLIRVYKPLKNITASLSFLNIGNQFVNPEDDEDTETYFSQTIGGHFNYNKNNLSIKANTFAQLGKDRLGNNLNTYYFALEAKWKRNNIVLELGFENFSGNDDNALSNGDNNAFTPLFGNNHWYNGFMDYFFVGNHINNIGLIDIYAGALVTLSDISKLSGKVHYFSGNKKINLIDSKELGVEVDIFYTHKVHRCANLAVGYSHMFATDNLKLIKGIDSNETNNFIWTMLTIKPNLFSNER